MSVVTKTAKLDTADYRDFGSWQLGTSGKGHRHRPAGEFANIDTNSTASCTTHAISASQQGLRFSKPCRRRQGTMPGPSPAGVT